MFPFPASDCGSVHHAEWCEVCMCKWLFPDRQTLKAWNSGGGTGDRKRKRSHESTFTSLEEERPEEGDNDDDGNDDEEDDDNVEEEEEEEATGLSSFQQSRYHLHPTSVREQTCKLNRTVLVLELPAWHTVSSPFLSVSGDKLASIPYHFVNRSSCSLK